MAEWEVSMVVDYGWDLSMSNCVDISFQLGLAINHESFNDRTTFQIVDI